MNGFFIYVFVADIITALIFMLVTYKDRSIENHCDKIGVDITTVVIIGILLGFILLPLSAIRSVKEWMDKRRSEKNGD